MSDVFREVSEDLRREQLRQLWKRFGKYIIGAAVLIVVIVAGYQIVQSIQQGQQQDSGDRYQAAFDLYRNGDLDGAAAAFIDLTEDGYGDYPSLAMMALANIRSEQGDTAAAVEAFDRVATDEGAPVELRDSAKLRAAFLLVDTASLADIQSRLSEFTDAGNPYRVLALEAMALSAIAAAEYDQAGQYVVQMVQDPFANDATTGRASVLYAYIISHMPAPAGGVAAAPAGAAAVPGFAAGAPGVLEALGGTPEAPAAAASGAVPGFAAEPAPAEEATPAPAATPGDVLTTPFPGFTNPVPFLPITPAN